MKYLQDTRYLPLILEDDDSSVLKWYIDGSFAIYNDMKSRTGINLTMGKSIIYGSSLKHKHNSKSSEAELTSVLDRISQVLWTKYFLECQGYQGNSSTIYQDNKASIRLERNCKVRKGLDTLISFTSLLPTRFRTARSISNICLRVK